MRRLLARGKRIDDTTKREEEDSGMTNNTSGMTLHDTSAGIQGGMAEAMRLMQAGQLNEATALIQRNLGSQAGTPTMSNTQPAPMETIARFMPTGAGTDALTSLPTMPGGLFGGQGMPQFGMPTTTARTSTPNQAPFTPPAEASPGAGRFVTGSYTNGAGTRGYKLYIPSGSTGEPLPLLVMLHGCTQSADDFAAGTHMNELAESGEFLVVYPEQAQNANISKCWNWFQAGDQQRDRGEPSIIAGITRQVSETHPVDKGRIYVAGMSAGGAMAVIMAATYPDLYAAVGVHSGLAYGAAHDMASAFNAMRQGGSDIARVFPRAVEAEGAVDLAGPVPTIVFHGDRDGTVHQRNGEQVLHQWTGGAMGAPKAKVRRGQESGGHAYTRSVYESADGEPVAERWLVHGAGHAWSGGSPRGSYTDPQGPDASAEMVRFFLEHPRS